MKQGMDKYYSNNYRMTGNLYKPGVKSFLRKCMSHNLQFAFYFRRYKEHLNLLFRLIRYRLSRKYGLEISTNV